MSGDAGPLTSCLPVGGQAVIEGVMMRSPRSFAVAVRKADGNIVVREQQWVSLWEKLPLLKKPFLRGSVVLIESLWNGMSALAFAAEQSDPSAADPSAADPSQAGTPETGASAGGMTSLQITLTMALSFVLAMGLFVGLPHALTWGIGWLSGTALDVDSFAFHAIDGVIKLIILTGYMWLISLMPDIQRVFMYHGAEHKSIHAYELGLPLSVENALAQTRIHPRCGTSFLVIVMLTSMLFFALAFPFVPKLFESTFANQLANVAMKIAFMFPVAGLSYELQRLTARHMNNPLVRAISQPGMWLQRITTREPDDTQLEVALAALRVTLWREEEAQRSTARIESREGAMQIVAGLTDLEARLAG